MVLRLDESCIRQEIFGHDGLIQSILFVEPKEAGPVQPFLFNEAQKLYIENATERDLILKARQLGVTTLKIAENVCRALFFNQHCFILSHEGGHTRRLLDMARRMIRRIPQELVPPPEQDNRNRITFMDGGSLTVNTASARAFGRGDTVQSVHGSEVALWEIGDDYNTWAAISQAVPRRGCISFESTPRGSTGLFYKLVNEARGGNSLWRLHFLPWWLGGTDYSLPVYTEWHQLELSAPITTEESMLILKYSLTPAQIAWRRWKRAELGYEFYQEYPEDDISCFLGTGSTFFDSGMVSIYLQTCRPPVEEIDGWKLWVLPKAGGRYIIGADIGGGGMLLDPEGEEQRGSFTTAAVLDVDTNEFVGTYRRLVPPLVFATELLKMGTRYNTACLAPESNFFGNEVLRLIRDQQYANILVTRRSANEDAMRATGSLNLRYGWRTDMYTRPRLLATFEEAVRTHQFMSYDRQLFNECLTFVQKINPITHTERYAAAPGAYDDLLFAHAIAWVNREYARRQRNSIPPTPVEQRLWL